MEGAPSVARVATPLPGRQRGERLAHKLLVTQGRGHRSIAFSGGTCRLEATEAALVLRLDATDPAPLETLQEFVARHLLRFAFRAPPAIRWIHATA